MESTDPLLVSHAERLSKLEGIAEQLNKMLETFGAEVRDQRGAGRQAILYADNAYVYDDAFYGWFGRGGIDEIVGLFEGETKGYRYIESARAQKARALLIGLLEGMGKAHEDNRYRQNR